MGNTNWLTSCESSEECEDGTRCVCGVCSLYCESSSDCVELAGSVCDTSSDALASACGAAMPEEGLCLPECSDSVPCGDGQRCVDDHCLPEASNRDGGVETSCQAVPTCLDGETMFATEALCQEQSDDCRESTLCGASVWCAEPDPTTCDEEPVCDAGETTHESADACGLESDVCREVSVCDSSVWCGDMILDCQAEPTCEAWEIGYSSAAECEQQSSACRQESVCRATIWCAPRCAPQLVDFTEECSSIALSYYWTGSRCVDSGGCTCEGPDCEAGFATMEACVDAHSACADAVPCGGFAGNTCQDDEYCAYIPAQDNCGALDGMATCQPMPDACDGNYDPVCGCDSETYGNACEAASAGVGLTAFGECQ